MYTITDPPSKTRYGSKHKQGQKLVRSFNLGSIHDDAHQTALDVIDDLRTGVIINPEMTTHVDEQDATVVRLLIIGLVATVVRLVECFYNRFQRESPNGNDIFRQQFHFLFVITPNGKEWISSNDNDQSSQY